MAVSNDPEGHDALGCVCVFTLSRDPELVAMTATRNGAIWVGSIVVEHPETDEAFLSPSGFFVAEHAGIAAVYAAAVWYVDGRHRSL